MKHTASLSQDAAPRAKKSLGQNFLQDANIARKIVRALDIDTDDSIVEIGPGPGALTRIITGYSPSRLVLVEKDHHWARARRQDGGVSVILADAMTVPWERFDRPWKFIGNLPYNVASPLMWDIFSRSSGLVKAVFMVQKEVGLRLTARSGTSAYGALSVWIQSFVEPKMEFIVPPQVFHPRPKVDSAVVSFVPVKGREDKKFHPEALSRLLKICFQMRRKQLGTIFRAAGLPVTLLEACAVDPKLRPEQLAPEVFHCLSLTM